MKLTKAEIAMLKESLEFGIYHVRDGTADYKQREAKMNEMQALSTQANADGEGNGMNCPQ